MVSVVQANTQPIGMFAGGELLSGGAANPTITTNFGQTSDSDSANYPDGLPPKFSTTNGLVQSSGISAVAITKSTFKSKVSGVAGTYTFMSYDDNGTTKWKLTSPSAADPITLYQYGINITGTTVPGEGIAVEYIQGSTASDYSVTLLNIIRTYIVQNVAKKFLIGDMNLIGYLGTLEQYRRQMGGIRTYDPAFASVIDGYPKGAQLEYLQVYDGSTLLTRSDIEDQGFGYTDSYTYKMRKVLSLIDDNTYDFVATPSYIDNQKWMYCDVVEENLPTLPSSTMRPQIVCWVNIYSTNTSAFNKTYSATLLQDSYLTAKVWPIGSQFSRATQNIDVEISTTLNGRTQTFAYCWQRGNYSSIEQYFGNGYIVKAGTTVRTEIKYQLYTDSFIPFVEVGACVLAVPVNAGNTIRRL